LVGADALLKRMQQVNDAIARRAFSLFERNGFRVGHDFEDWLRAESEILHPLPTEMVDTEKELIVRAEVPGFTEKEVEVKVEGSRLYISGKREEKKEKEEGKLLYSETVNNEIFRCLSLPTEVDPENVKATLSNGVLEVSMPKMVTGRKVPVQTAA
jgi:HSP20 family protein